MDPDSLLYKNTQKTKPDSDPDRVGHPFFSKERNILVFFCVLFKITKRSLRSFTFFIKECGVLCVLCVLLRSL